MPLNCWVWLARDCLRACALYVAVDIVSFGCQGYFAVMEDEGKWIGGYIFITFKFDFWVYGKYKISFFEHRGLVILQTCITIIFVGLFS